MTTKRTLGKRYRLVSKLGEGGMAEVYLATDLLLNRPVAIKILHAQYAGDREFVERFRREAQAAASLSHPNVVNIYDVGEDGDTYYIVLEYVRGRNLKDVLRTFGPLPPLQAAVIARAVASAVDAAHRRGLIHRDIKPHNILITDEGRVKVTDFGIARAVSSATLTQTGTLLGSVHYFSPEQARGTQIGPTSDIYSLGVVLYEMLTGRVPFTADTPISVALKHIEEEPVPPSRWEPKVPRELEAIVLKAMAKDPAERYQSPAAMVADLRRFTRTYDEDDEAELLTAVLRVRSEPPALTGGARDEEAERSSVGSTRSFTPRPVPARALSNRGPSGSTGRSRRVQAPSVDEPVLEAPTQVAPTGSDAVRKVRRRTKGRSRAWRWAGVALFVLLVYVGMTHGAPSVMNWIFPPDVEVPAVVGLHVDEARQRLQQRGLELEIERRVFHSSVPAFHVIQQSPDARRVVKMGRTIAITMSLGPEIAPVPDVRGLPEREARLLLTQSGFVLGTIHEEPAVDVPINTVLGQSPEAGVEWEKGRPVDLWVARHERPVADVRVPDFRGLPVAEVRRRLQVLGLVEGNLWPEESSAIAPGRIVDQNPPPGTTVPAGTAVDFVYSERAVSDEGDRAATISSAGASAAERPVGDVRFFPVTESHRYQAKVSIHVPPGPPQEVVIVIIDDFGAREVYRDVLDGGTRFERDVEGRGRGAQAQIYVGGAMVENVRLDR